MEFITEMDLAYAAADVVVSRAGALSISEICLAGKPAIFVPSPNVAEDHQTKNANTLVEHKAAMMITDINAREQLIPAALDLIKDTARQQVFRENIKELAKPYAASRIVDEIIKLIEKK
jgi:UDP-N-acetylglucosamine--N-acetylmuramyl-(pentapeptide) pyrophosphoryl-undecaprenol N-acetylglucosamine transferase